MKCFICAQYGIFREADENSNVCATCRPQAPLFTAYQFFKEHAAVRRGFCSTVALALAKAEIWARDNDYIFAWDFDECAAEFNAEADEVLGCAMSKRGSHKSVASLWGIGDPDNDYRRVVEAELALEEMTKHVEASENDSAAKNYMAL